MRPVYKIAAFVSLLATIALLLTVIREWNYSFDQHGFYTGAGGILHRESQTELNQFLLTLSALLLFVTSLFGFKKPVASTRPE